MNTYVRLGLVLGCLSSLVSVPLQVMAAPHTLQLLSRTAGEDHAVNLSEVDRAWLQHKKTLILGVSEPDYAPFEIMNTGDDLEGITGDFTAMLSSRLKVDVEVKHYASRTDAIGALKQGAVDMLGTSSRFERAHPGLVQSRAYLRDQSILVVRENDQSVLAPDLAGKRVAMFDHYLPLDAVQALYPRANVQLYPTHLAAIGAVAFGKADVYLGDYISANYLINKNYLNNVHLAGFSRVEASQFSFAMSADNPTLARIINTVLDTISVNDRASILRRWSAGAGNMQARRQLQLSEGERDWIEQHPVVKVLVNDDLPPLSFVDENGNFRGITADVLARVSLLSGLKFDLQRGNAPGRMLDEVKAGNADALAAFIPNIERGNELLFTRPYLTTPLVLISPGTPQEVPTLDVLAGKKIAVVHNNLQVQRFITEHFPSVQVVPGEASTAVLGMTAKGTVDAAIVPLISARYLLARDYSGKMSISSTVGSEPARVAFGINPGSPQLHSIIDKALLSIAPDEMDELTNRWRNEVLTNSAYWFEHRATILQGLAASALLLLLALWWIARQRRLINRLEVAETALSDQLEFQNVLVDGTPHPIYVRNREGRMVSCNQSYLDFFKFVPDDVIGKTIVEMKDVDPVVGRAYHDECMAVMESGQPLVRDRRLITLLGDEISIYHWLLPYRGSDGNVVGIVSGWLDISERERLLEQAHEARGAAEEANRAKTRFFATLSHEIRTPMNAVIGMLELAMKKADQGILDRVAIDVASDAAHNLLELIGDILDVARMESGRMALAPERINLRVQVECLLSIFEGMAQRQQLVLIPHISADADCDVLLDTLRFKQIMSNILSNAIKFTTEGEIRLIVDAHANYERDLLKVRLLVEDTGSGISIEDQERLFHPFAQGSNNVQSGRGGSGLGLVISRNLCEMMGGELRLNSELGKGTQIEMLFELPILAPIEVADIQADELVEQLRILNVLVVDDYPANRMVMTQQLAYLGHRSEDAPDGSRGLSAWRSGRFDVIITDCNMPVVDGYDMTRAIRHEEAKLGLEPCLILGFTASVDADEQQRCLEAGMNDCLTKPISLKELSKRLAQVEPGNYTACASGFGEEMPQGRIDLSNLSLLTRGDAQTLNGLLADLASSNTDDMAQLATSYVDQDLQGLEDLAHRVKGGARIIKAKWLIEACEQLELACRADVEAEPEALEQSVTHLAREMMAIADALKARSEM
ncbi:transporter substrate-binding domain-containing protein [Pseudomonas sp. L1(2025)]|uniref:transporter substrate-binding domain-containing protein n=1 Tax=Pseudomonas sp. L1(2025) TaxID=3449429 RepID=UPI003F69295A